MKHATLSGSPIEPAAAEAELGFAFDPIHLVHRTDGWTPEKQRAFIEELADCGVVREAAARVGMTEQSARRLRRRPDATAFNLAWESAVQSGAERLRSIAFERAIEGTVRRRYFKGEVVGEDRVFDNRLLIYLLRRTEDPRRSKDAGYRADDWSGWLNAVEDGLPVSTFAPDGNHRSPVWRDDYGNWLTSFPPPDDFAGRQWDDGGYCRELTEQEFRAVTAWETRAADEAARHRDCYFRRLDPNPPRACLGDDQARHAPGMAADVGGTSAPGHDHAQHGGGGPSPTLDDQPQAGGEVGSDETHRQVDSFAPPSDELSELSIPPRACLGEGDRPAEPVGGGVGEGDHPAEPGGGGGTLNCPDAPRNDAPSPQAYGPFVTLYAHLAARIDAILDDLVASGDLPADLKRGAVTVEPPRDPAHGDLATNAAMVLAKPAGTNPRALAALIAPRLEALDEVKSAEIAGPGFINLRLDPKLWQDELRAILADGDAYGKASVGTGERVNVEYVSANPTGPMHMGHCRGAVVGDALASLLEYAGFAVTREYYVNDAGAQVDTLARSAWLRYREALGLEIGDIPEGLYPGDYLKPVGAALAVKYGGAYRDSPESEWLDLFKREAVAAMMELIKADLALLGIHHDKFASEAEVQGSGAADRALETLTSKGLIYQGMLEAPKGETPEDYEPVELTLFRSTQFGDDQDRPMKKSDGSWTYFGADAAYHLEKAQSADDLINIWGADHSGTVKRIQAAVAALTDGKVELDVKLVQMVRLFRAGEPVKMSKRSGSFVTLADVVREVGKDVVRFMMLTRRADAPLDFDFAKVVEVSKDNPVFYVQYAHARISSLQRKAKEAGLDPAGPADLTLLDDEELALVQLAAQFPRVVVGAAQAHEPHRIAFYLQDLAAAFHALWNRGNDDPSRRFLVGNNPQLTSARLELAAAIGQVVRNGLAIMGVAAAQEMH